jgi:hypothetical protein
LGVKSLFFGLLLLVAAASPAQAQRSCTELHARMMGAYQMGSGRYMDLRQRYEARCGGGGQEEFSRRRGGGRECDELRAACLQKERLGERGEGNCRRYRETCRR